MTEIDPDAESSQDPRESSKSFGEHVKDAAEDLKEDVKDAVRRDKGDDEDDASDEGDEGDERASE
jgi:hypothetical protein